MNNKLLLALLLAICLGCALSALAEETSSTSMMSRYHKVKCRKSKEYYPF